MEEGSRPLTTPVPGVVLAPVPGCGARNLLPYPLVNSHAHMSLFYLVLVALCEDRRSLLATQGNLQLKGKVLKIHKVFLEGVFWCC